MEKSLFTSDYQALLSLLKEARRRSGITQESLAARLGTTQSFISKCERGDRRLDVIELRRWVLAIDQDFHAFLTRFDDLVSDMDADCRRQQRRKRSSPRAAGKP